MTGLLVQVAGEGWLVQVVAYSGLSGSTGVGVPRLVLHYVPC